MTAASAFVLFHKLRNRLGRAETELDAPCAEQAPAPAAPAAPAVDDALRQIPGILAPMLEAFGENGIRTVEDLAASATDGLVGWAEQSGGVTPPPPGILRVVGVPGQQCDAITLRARIRAGGMGAAGV